LRRALSWAPRRGDAKSKLKLLEDLPDLET